MECAFGKKPKHPHPKEIASKFSHLFFFWQISLLLKWYKKDIKENDLYGPLKEHECEILGDKLERAWLIEVQKAGKNASLWKVLRKVFGLEFLKYGLCLIPLELVFRILIPVYTGKLIIVYAKDKNGNFEIYMYTILLLVVTFIRILAIHPYWFEMEHLGMKIRLACGSLIYRKCLKMEQKTLARVTLGQIVNLLASDVTRFNCGLIRYIHYLWLAPLQMVVVLYVFYNILGLTALYGALLFVVFMPFGVFLSRRISICQSKVAFRTDSRVRIIREIIEGIKVIKMFAWEKPFAQLAENYRKLEMKFVRATLYANAMNLSLSTIVPKISVFFSIFFYLMGKNFITPEYLFVVSGFSEIMRALCGVFFLWGITSAGEVNISVKRIENFLKNPDIFEMEKNLNKSISITNACVKYNENIFDDLTLTIKDKKLLTVIGQVGCGKSTLLQMILGEINLFRGSVKVGGTISYAPQEPWLFGGTVRENILFGEKLDQEKYKKVIKICALERDLSSLAYGDMSYIGDRGTRLSGGQRTRINLARCVYKDADFYLLDDPLSSVDAQVGKFIFKNCIKTYLGNKSVVLVTHQLQFLNEVDHICLLQDRKIAACGTYKEVMNDRRFQEFKTEEANFIEEVTLDNFKEEQDLEQCGFSSGIYMKYLKASGRVWLPLLLIFLKIVTFAVAGGIEFFLALWVNTEQKKQKPIFENFIYIYTTFLVAVSILVLTSMLSFVKFFSLVSTNLHNVMLKKIVYAPLQFFSLNPSGRIINRFSSDIGQVDRFLPVVVWNMLIIFLMAFAVIIFSMVLNYWIILPTLLLTIMVFFLRKIFLHSSVNLKRMEARSRSPTFSHLTSTLQGLPIIRALQAQSYQTKLFDSFQNDHSSAYYLFLASESAIGFWVDVCCFVYYGIIVCLLINLELDIGSFGLILTQSTVLMNMLQYGVKQYTEMENQMVAVERILDFSNVETEHVDGIKLTRAWPLEGKLEFRTISLRYQPQQPLVLNQVSFLIHPKEKIGIVGRTGAGKSSITSVLFRLFEYEGKVFIDDVNTKTLSLKDVRSNISIIPQEPVLFSSTIRTNLDPHDKYQDSQLWEALEEVELRKLVSELPGGLSSKVTEGGSNFSVGQRQLICLARAIIKMNKILIMDEATANVDFHTEELIQATIKKKFRECTVLTIAHRLHTVLDFDRVLVMDAGRVVEFDSPATLLQNSDGFFYRLINSDVVNVNE